VVSFIVAGFIVSEKVTVIVVSGSTSTASFAGVTATTEGMPGVGVMVGEGVGETVGEGVGETVGEGVGETVGEAVGETVGDGDGAVTHVPPPQPETDENNRTAAIKRSAAGKTDLFLIGYPRINILAY
jgi:hypothetical protein